MTDDDRAQNVIQAQCRDGSEAMELSEEDNAVTQEWVSALVMSEAKVQDPDLVTVLRPLRAPGRNTGPPGSTLKVWFGVKCTCETAAVLSVEVERSKTREEVIVAMPQIVDRLRVQHRGFLSMSCSTHQNMRTSFTSGIGSEGD